MPTRALATSAFATLKPPLETSIRFQPDLDPHMGHLLGGLPMSHHTP